MKVTPKGKITKRKWVVECSVVHHVTNKDCPVRIKERGKWICDETGEKCCWENYYGCEI
jgi:hypothetical protein